MSSREFIALGTSSQVPTRHRNHNGYFLRWDEFGFVFDPGEGSQRQMLRYGVRTSQIHRILITHFHGDHCLGLAGLVQRISLDEVVHPVPVHYPASGQRYFDRLTQASIFDNRAEIVPCPFEGTGTLVDEETFSLEARELEHRVPTLGYRLVEPPGRRMLPDLLAKAGVKGPDVGKLQREGAIGVGGKQVLLEEVSEFRPGQTFAFVMDTRLCDAAIELARDADLLVCESTYLETESSEARERGHMTARDAAEVASSAGARRLVLTHFSQRYPDVEPFLEEASRLHSDVVAVRDGDTVAVPRRLSE